MFVVDDPFLALILRFVVDSDGPDAANEEFLQHQLKELRMHLAGFPKTEHRSRAVEWIAEHAARYRRDWERNTLARRTVYLRCADCPLAELGATEFCEIHEQWLYLLHRYLTDETTSRQYIEDALALLAQYKAQHRHRLTFAAIHASGSNKANRDKGKKKKKNGKKNGKEGGKKDKEKKREA
jgi:hypothetical protein